MSPENSRNLSREIQNLHQAMGVLEGQRAILGDQTVDIALSSIREKIARLELGNAASPEDQQRKLITVLFADVSGFTAMAEAMDHEIVTDVINSLWSRVDKAIQDHGGRIDKPRFRCKLKYKSGRRNSVVLPPAGNGTPTSSYGSGSTPVPRYWERWERSVSIQPLAIR